MRSLVVVLFTVVVGLGLAGCKNDDPAADAQVPKADVAKVDAKADAAKPADATPEAAPADLGPTDAVVSTEPLPVDAAPAKD